VSGGVDVEAGVDSNITGYLGQVIPRALELSRSVPPALPRAASDGGQ
jgi:hypothetical protein